MKPHPPSSLGRSTGRKPELLLLAMTVVMGCFLRVAHTERLAVEHFDEGVYAAGLWFTGSADHDSRVFADSYPASHLYAPPLLPTAIEWLAVVPGCKPLAPFLPAVILGTLFVPLLWWIARTWFGLTAGLFVAFVICFSDYHILYSRMALTDVPVLFWICLATGLAATGLHRSSVRMMILAGVATGLGWWTKYSGWLPLAITASGSGLWWCLGGRRTMSLPCLLKLVITMAVSAVVVWLPWFWQLQSYGGYSEVARNHSGYFVGFTQWQDNLARHILYSFQLDSWLGPASIALGVLAAGTRRWIELARSTWNDDMSRRLTPLLGRFVIAALVMGIVAAGVSSVGLLVCLGMGGLAGMFLWPTLSDLHRRRETGDLTPPCDGASACVAADIEAAPQIDPRIGACFVVTWFLGMVLTTPMYHPFPRLSLPLLASVWLAAAAGVGWWMEASVNAVRRGENLNAGRGGFWKRMLRGMVMAVVILALVATGGITPPSIWQDRTSLRDASWQLAGIALQDADGTFTKEPVPMNANGLGIISPDPAEADDNGPAAPDTAAQLRARIAPVADVSTPLATKARPTCVIYGFGEPSVLWHLSAAGLNVTPVQDLNFGAARLSGKILPTYLVLGPNALRTPGLLNDWALAQYRFEHVADVGFAPSQVVLYNLFSPEWVGQHVEARVQKLELYRLITDQAE
ncbi:MAG: glycosyltransferase family 39 protein [Fuerstiella sp.]